MGEQALVATLWFVPAVWGLVIVLRSSAHTRLARGVSAYRAVFGTLLVVGLVVALLGGILASARRLAEEPRTTALLLGAAGLVVAGAATRALARPTARAAAFAAWSAFVDPVLVVVLDGRAHRDAVPGWSQDQALLLSCCVFVAWLVGICGCYLATRAFEPATNLPPARVR